MITVYTKERCPACRSTERYLNEHEVKYVGKKLVGAKGERLLPESQELINKFRSKGYAQFPVVVTQDDAWCGFRPDKLKNLL